MTGESCHVFRAAPRFLGKPWRAQPRLLVPECPDTQAAGIILKQVRALVTLYLHQLSIVYFTSYPSGSSQDVANKSCDTIKEAIHHAS